MAKYFVSCAVPGRRLGAMQFEAEDEPELVRKSEELCPEKAFFKAYELKEFETSMPIDIFVNAEEMIKLGYGS